MYRLVEEFPHELDKIEKVVEDARKENQYVRIEFSEVIKSNTWDEDEKIRLLRFFKYNTCRYCVEYIDSHNQESIVDYLYAIKINNISSFKALMEIQKDYIKPKYESYEEIFYSIKKIVVKI